MNESTMPVEGKETIVPNGKEERSLIYNRLRQQINSGNE